jgi:signal transduction histidine kinase
MAARAQREQGARMGLPRGRVDLEAMVDEVLRELRLALELKRAQVAFAKGPGGKVRGASQPLRLAVTNVLLNAVEATPVGGKVTIALEGDSRSAQLRVTDCGRLTPQARARAFELRFSTKPGHDGLGLPVARSIARAHGGDVWFADSRDTSVILQLPRRA